MDISEKKQIPLNTDCQSFKPKKEKNLDQSKLSIDLNLMEESEQPIKIEDFSRRKISSDSTSASKVDDTSELFNIANLNTPQNSPKSRITFFGRDKNCLNPIYNFYQTTEENLQELYPKYKNYKKTKNYILKKDFYNNSENSENKVNNIVENLNNSQTSSIINNSNNLSNLNYINSLQTTSVAANIGTYFPNISNICSGVNGKFDLQKDYVGFYGWESKSYFFLLNIFLY